ncbi:type VI secretion system tip protein TssI/VgrG [Acinetobacter bereziniae]|uniref:type VI secretion system tip protein TssI/VgrG n=1 Tax=Acinetobacter bereziniae TaxID=106648 RepID=UPI0019004B58|nr:type VI secretion system tip protein TssI/VgrG [Acinetobacter bereziniae]MBJ9909484.1 type VI secretion system tip protein VgrG [Acinetobacter bereziniae]MBJ9930450.1 type VI secretion system tip protein VgrG [Acinetobacter bereziniae]
MFNNIYFALEKLGLTAQKRAIHVSFSNTDLNQLVFLQRVDGIHAINDGMNLQLICLSTLNDIALKRFIGCRVAIDVVNDCSEINRISGIVTKAEVGASDGALTIYRLTVEDPTALWKQRRNSRVFMNMSALQVVEVIFNEWRDRSPLFASSLTLDKSGLTKDYDIRPFIMQNNERDIDLIQRLLASEGVTSLIDEAQLKVSHFNEPIQPQKLRLIDDNTQYKSLERRTIRFHRSSAVETRDSIINFTGQRSLQPTSVHIQRWQADILETEEGAGNVQSKHQHSDQYDNASLGLEQVWHFSPAWTQDLNGEDGATPSSNSQIERFNQNLSNYYDAQAKQFTAISTVRDAQVGYHFELDQHPSLELKDVADRQFLIISKTFYHQNNLPKDLSHQVEALIRQSQWQLAHLTTNNNEERQANQLVLQRRNITVVPEYNPLTQRPAAHPMRARVVGPSGEEIHVDEWGRIKVRFLFTRNEDHSHDGGAGSNDNDTDSAWVDVLTPWAGEGYGARFLPRIGELVVVDFFAGDIDRPFVVGRIHEGYRYPTKFDDKGKLPDTKKLAGIKSLEYQGSGYNQLRFDDTTNQISSQLHSSHGTTQLNLGNLSHPKETDSSEGRGEGFELRTDQWGAVRAGQGLLLSTHAQDGASGNHLDTTEAKRQLENSLNNTKALSEVAKHQQTDPLKVLNNLKHFLNQIEKGEKDKADAFKQALMLLASPNSIAMSTNSDLHLSADGQISQSAGKSINLSSQKNLIAHAKNKISLFAAQEGARLYAAKGKVEIKAHSDGADLIARKGIQIISTEDTIYMISPKEIVFRADTSELRLNGSGIFSTTPGLFEVKSGQQKLSSGMKVSAGLPLLPIVNFAPDQPLPTLKSTYAHDQLVVLAKTFSQESFVSLVTPIFGFDIPDSLYLALKTDLEKGLIQPPEHIVTAKSINGHAAGFNHQDKKIYLAADTVLSALENDSNLERLYTVLLHEYGHYIDDHLRISGNYSLGNSFNLYVIVKGNVLEEIAKNFNTTVEELCSLNQISDPNLIYIGDILKIPVKIEKLAPDAPRDEGAVYAYNLGQLTEGKDKGANTEFEFAEISSEKFSGKLKITPTSGKRAARMHADFESQMDEVVDVQYEYFGAGEGKFSKQTKILANRGTIDPKTGKYIKKDDNKGVRIEHGHQSIEKEAIGELNPDKPIFNKQTVDAIYAGNWLRDHSQLVCGAVLNTSIDVAIDNQGKITTIKPTRKLITNILAVLAYDHFFDQSVADDLAKLPELKLKNNRAVNLQKHMQNMLNKVKYEQLSEKNQRRYKALALISYSPKSSLPHRLFRDLTGNDGERILGVYRFEEHIDNPFGADIYTHLDKEFNPKPNDKTFQTNSDQKSAQFNLKNYIADNTPNNMRDSAFPTALEYMLGQLEESMKQNSSSDVPLRHLGNAFHVLEDFFSHSNFVEIALIKHGYTDVRHNVLRKNNFSRYEQIPLVTGTFDSWDTFASIGGTLAKMVDPLKEWSEYKGMVSGERSFSDLIIQEFIFTLDAVSKDKNLTKIWFRYLELRDEICALYEAGYVDLLKKAAKTISEFKKQTALLETLFTSLFKFLLKFGVNNVLKHSHDIVSVKQGVNPVIHGDNPSHTQLGKDEAGNPLHLLAANLAIIAVRDVGTKWNSWLEKPTTANKQAVLDTAKSYFRHPSRCNWMDESVKQWARQNKDKVNQASDGMLQKGWDTTRQGAYKGAKAAQEKIDEAAESVQKGLDMMKGGKK